MSNPTAAMKKVEEPASPATVTGLQVVVNQYGSTVSFINTENSGNNRTIGSQTASTVGNAWIPWCDTPDSFPGHHMQVTSTDGTLRAYLWQHADHIRMSTTGFESPGTPISGNSNIGQSVLLVVTVNGSLGLTAYIG